MNFKIEFKKVKVRYLKVYDKNPRFIDDSAFQALKNSIKKFGLVQPLIIDEEYKILGGNQRFIACKELGYKEVDCYVIFGLSEEEKIKLNLVLNSPYTQGQYNVSVLQDLLNSLNKNLDYLDLNLDKLELFYDENLNDLNPEEIKGELEKNLKENDLVNLVIKTTKKTKEKLLKIIKDRKKGNEEDDGQVLLSLINEVFHK